MITSLQSSGRKFRQYVSRSLLNECSSRRLPTSARGFTLVELLVVIGIIAILSAIAVPLIPSLLRANQMDSNVATLSGILEQARETAISSDTYVWVAFTDPPATSAVSGTWVAVIKSIDGTESPINTAAVPAWAASVAAIPAGNLQLLSKIQNLGGVQIAALTSPPLAASLVAKASSFTPYATTFTPATWTVTPLKYTTAGAAGVTYCKYALEFTPDGEAHQGGTSWYNYIIFGITPSIGSTASKTTNDALFVISRLTGRATVYRQ